MRRIAVSLALAALAAGNAFASPSNPVNGAEFRRRSRRRRSTARSK